MEAETRVVSCQVEAKTQVGVVTNQVEAETQVVGEASLPQLLRVTMT